MNKCFITKLPSSVDNDNLPVLGQLRINWLKQSDLANNEARAIALSTNDSITIKVSGAHFTDNTLASNIGNTKIITAADGVVLLYVSNDVDAVLTIDNKYSLTKLICNTLKNPDWINPHPIYFDIEDIKYCTNLNYLDVRSTQVSGDISVLSNFTNLTNLELANSQVSGDISVLSELTNIQSLNIENVQVSGNISVLSNFTNLTKLVISNTNITGAFDSLTSLTKLKNIWAINTLLTGDMSKIPANCITITVSSANGTTVYTWSANSRQNVKLLTISGKVPMDTTSIDNMLIDQATCEFNINEYPKWFQAISVVGTRTSASDAAVTAIQNKGVTITGVTKQA